MPEAHQVQIDERDLEWAVCKSGGPGGQHVNKTNSAVQLTHRPTGSMIRSEGERSQLQNRQAALALLRARLAEQQRTAIQGARNGARQAQVGTGMRADKVITIAIQRDQVTHHVKRMSVKQYLRGDLEALWP